MTRNSRYLSDKAAKPAVNLGWVAALNQRWQLFRAGFNGQRWLSFKTFTAVNAIVLMLPLFASAVYTAVAMHRTTESGMALNARVFAQTKALRQVVQKTAELERKARLYILLAEPGVQQANDLNSFEAARVAFSNALNELLNSQPESPIALLLHELIEKEKWIYPLVVAGKRSSETQLNDQFRGLRETAAQLEREFEHQVDSEFKQVQQDAQSLNQTLITEGVLLLTLVMAYTGLLWIFMSRGLVQISRAISDLGHGRYEQVLTISGPAELRDIGEKLEWLRLGLGNAHRQAQHSGELADALRQVTLDCQWLLHEYDQLSVAAVRQAIDRIHDDLEKLTQGLDVG